jgi:H+-transporting ATPase
MSFDIRSTSEYEEMSLEDAFRALGTSPRGLSEVEAEERIEVYGYNEVAGEKRAPIAEFLLRYWGPMPWLLELAMVLSFLLEHILEGVIIFVLLTINAVIGQVQSSGSQKAVELLKQKLAIKTEVLRNGEWTSREARDIVPGDIVLLKLGEILPADAKVLDAGVSLDDSVITGESLPKDIGPSGIAYSGSMVKRGESRCIVVNTGVNTYFGRTVELVKIAKPRSHQQEVMLAIVKYMMYLGITASIIVAAYALLLRQDPLLVASFVVIFLMGAVPVALPAVLTIVEAVGARELANKGALVTRLDSIEDAASIDILCIDKTGTLTQNRLSVASVTPLSGFREEDVVRTAYLSSREEGMDLIDTAVIDYAKASGVDLGGYRRATYMPFDPSTRRTEAVIESNEGDRFRVVKGAYQVLLSLCDSADDELRGECENSIDAFSEKGYRTIAVAMGEDEEPDALRIVGLIALADPPRPDARSMIEEAKRMDIKPIMLTGDNLAIARETAREVGIGSNVLRFSDIRESQGVDESWAFEEVEGLAEVYPEDKYRIVKSLQENGHMVGMTGDGVNDAPALKQAEMGIAVADSTDVAKASASVVLTETSIGVIIGTISTSRQTYQRMLSWVINKITKVIEFVGLLTIGFFLFRDVIISLLGMSLLVVANDFVTISLATDNVKHSESPNRWDLRRITLASIIPGILFLAEDLLVILIGNNYLHLDWDKLQTLVLLSLVFNSQFRILLVRERDHFWSSFPGKSLLVASVTTIIVFVLLAWTGLLVPALALPQILMVLGLSAAAFVLIDFPKYCIFRKLEL